MPKKVGAKTTTKSKSAALKSKAAKSKASWSTDDVYNLLKAVNEITLRRMEDKEDRIKETVARVNNWVNSILSTVDRIEQTLGAIKAKTDRLP